MIWERGESDSREIESDSGEEESDLGETKRGREGEIE